jgi:pseudaminic acid biosynthesis-associated methylase
MGYKTEQENFWAGEFGNQYLARNDGAEFVASNLVFFSRALKMAGKIDSCIEFGANIGMNLRSLSLLYPKLKKFGIEINNEACNSLSEHLGPKNIFNGSILDFSVQKTYELALIRGVLIHINPEMLQDVYQKLYESTNRYVLLIEYYNPTPVEVPYRGHQGKLFKRDFAGEMLDKFPDLKLVDYGFGYHRDESLHGKVDDGTWFLLEKSS